MASHNSPQSTNSAYPIDLVTVAHELSRRFGEQEHITAWQELGGILPPPHDERADYLPFANIYEQDSRKLDIHRGLGELGLIALVPKQIQTMPKPKQFDYAAALLKYDDQLVSRNRLLRVPKQIESDTFQKWYPNTDQNWANTYASELGDLREVLVGGSVFAAVKRVLHDNPHEVYKRKHTLIKSHVVAVHFDPNNQPLVVRVKPASGKYKAA